MYQASSAFEAAVQQDSRTFRAAIKIGSDLEITDGIMSVEYYGGSNADDDFRIGSTVSSYITVSISDPSLQIESKEMLLSIGIEIGGETEQIPMGFFTAQKPESDESAVTVTAFDRMMKLEKAFFPSGTDTVSILSEIQAACGVPVVTAGLTPISMTPPEGYTAREVLGYIAEMYGGFACCSRSGEIEIHRWTDCGVTVGAGRYWDSFKHNDFLYILQRLRCYTGETEDGGSESISIGDGPREAAFSNPFMTQNILNAVWDLIGGFTYMPGNISFLGDPRLDPWDVITVEGTDGKSYKVPCMTIRHSFDGGLTTEVTASGLSEEESESGYLGPRTRQMERYYARLVMIDEALINKLDVETAEITYARIAVLEATQARVNELSANLAEIDEAIIDRLTTGEANIQQLNVNYANIETLLTGNAGAGNLQSIHLTSQNTVIDTALIRDAIAVHLTANDVFAGRISTDELLVGSDDGAFLIDGSTQTIRDADGNIRIQMGQDASGNFTFSLFDETGQGLLIDANGIKENAIADGLIKNAKVAPDAAIAASKLDIDSLFTEINNSGNTIRGSRIYLDEAGQTLSQSYTQLKSTQDAQGTRVTQIESGINGISAVLSEALETITDISTQVTANTTAVSAAQGAISAIISESELNELQGSGGTMYSAVTAINAGLSGVTTRVSSLETEYDSLSGEYTELNSRVTTFSTTLDGISGRVSSVESGLGTANSSIASIEATANSIGMEVMSLQDGETLISYINQTASSITIGADHLGLNAEEIRMKADTLVWEAAQSSMDIFGFLTCTGADIKGDITAESLTANSYIYLNGSEDSYFKIPVGVQTGSGRGYLEMSSNGITVHSPESTLLLSTTGWPDADEELPDDWVQGAPAYRYTILQGYKKPYYTTLDVENMHFERTDRYAHAQYGRTKLLMQYTQAWKMFEVDSAARQMYIGAPIIVRESATKDIKAQTATFNIKDANGTTHYLNFVNGILANVYV